MRGAWIADAAQPASVTVLINKPVGYVSGQPEPPYKPAITLVGTGSRFSGDRAPLRFNPLHLRGLAPAGRLVAAGPLVDVQATMTLRAMRVSLARVPAEVREGPHLKAARERLGLGPREL